VILGRRKEENMKNLKLLKVPDTIGENVLKAFDALTKEQRAYVRAELDYVERILTAFPQSADGERTPSGGCPCGGCYKCDEQVRDAVTALATVIDEYGYDVVRWHAINMGRDASDQILRLLLTVYLNLPNKKAAHKARAA